MGLGRASQTSAAERFAAAIEQAAALLDELGTPSAPKIAELLPERGRVRDLVALLERGVEWKAQEAAHAAAVEQGKRERAATEQRRLIGRFAATGDQAVLAQVTTDWGVAEARRQRKLAVDRFEPRVAEIVQDFRSGRDSHERARRRLRSLGQQYLECPRAELEHAEAEIERIAAA